MDNYKENATDLEDDELDLGLLIKDMIRGFRKFWPLFVLIVVVCSAGYGAYSLRGYHPRYQSKASFTVSTNSSADENYNYDFYYTQSTASQMAKTFPYILETDIFTDMICKDLGTESINGTITADAVAESNLFVLTVTSSSGEDAEAILNSVIENYPAVARYVIGDIKLNMIGMPSKADKPYNQLPLKKNVAKGALGGMALSFLLLFAYAILRKTVRKEEEIKEQLNIPYLGTVPNIPQKKRRNSEMMDLNIHNELLIGSFHETFSSLALRSIRDMEEEGQKVLMVTSSLKGEGVSLVSRNLAYAMADMEKKVILLNTNLREAHESEKPYGLEDYLNGKCSLEECLAEDKTGGCMTLACRKGMSAFNAANLQEDLKALVEELKHQFDYIVIDAPPCDYHSEAVVSVQCSDAMIYVIQQDFAKMKQVKEGIEYLHRYDAKYLGCLLNREQGGLVGYGYGGRYGKYYGSTYYYRGYTYNKYKNYSSNENSNYGTKRRKQNGTGVKKS